MTYPTISHFIENLTGIFIPLPIQTFGLFIVLAFLTGRYFIKKQFLRLEHIGYIKEVETPQNTKTTNIVLDYFFNGLISFLLGYKIIHIIQNYKVFSESPQKILLSSDGNLIVGLLFLIINVAYIYSFYKKDATIEAKTILPSDLSWNFLLCSRYKWNYWS